MSTPDVPEPDLLSPLHPEAPDQDHPGQVVAVGTDQVRHYLDGGGMPGDEIDSLIAAAHRTGTVSFVYASEPEGPAQQLTLSSGGEALQLAIAVGGAAGS